ncbi:MAG: DNA replication/repair protein RecF [Clostridiaceae bacterium]|nr:DNA replication/repair protein RecF [Clostridiaceae bacterium]
MYINSIELVNYRNYEREKVEFSPGQNVIFGDNAQGKTNLLESIYLFSHGKSHRTRQDRELILFGRDFLDVKVSFFSENRHQTGRIRVFKDKKKEIRINDVPLLKSSQLLGVFKVVLFTPDDLSLVKMGPEVRRKFLDSSISMIKPNYYGVLEKYNQVVKQKAALLKKIKKREAEKAALDIWNEKQADYASRLMAYRCVFIEALSKEAKQICFDISGEDFLILYKPSFRVVDFRDFSKNKNSLFEILQREKDAEIESGSCLFGPHRDDLIFLANNLDIKHFGSQGQQKTAVLSVKIALVKIIYDVFLEYPVLLLDDITGELDKSRREYLFKKIKNMQVLITCTDKELISLSGEYKKFQVKSGKIFWED